jgi:hypothetical protein
MAASTDLPVDRTRIISRLGIDDKPAGGQGRHSWHAVCTAMRTEASSYEKQTFQKF